MSAYEKAVRAKQVHATVQSNHLRVTVSSLQPEDPKKMSRSVRVGFHWDYSPLHALTEKECSELQSLLGTVLSEMTADIKRALRARYREQFNRMCGDARSEAEAILALSEQETTP